MEDEGVRSIPGALDASDWLKFMLCLVCWWGWCIKVWVFWALSDQGQ